MKPVVDNPAHLKLQFTGKLGRGMEGGREGGWTGGRASERMNAPDFASCTFKVGGEKKTRLVLL